MNGSGRDTFTIHTSPTKRTMIKKNTQKNRKHLQQWSVTTGLLFFHAKCLAPGEGAALHDSPILNQAEAGSLATECPFVKPRPVGRVHGEVQRTMDSWDWGKDGRMHCFLSLGYPPKVTSHKKPLSAFSLALQVPVYSWNQAIHFKCKSRLCRCISTFGDFGCTDVHLKPVLLGHGPCIHSRCQWTYDDFPPRDHGSERWWCFLFSKQLA